MRSILAKCVENTTYFWQHPSNTYCRDAKCKFCPSDIEYQTGQEFGGKLFENIF